jgi:hypothetical protein
MSSPHFKWVLPAVVVATIAISTIAVAIMNAGARAEASEGKAAIEWRLAQAAEPKKQRSENWASQVKPPETKKKQAAAEPPKPEADKDRGVPAGQLQPQLHASNGGITTCFDSLARASSQAVDGEHQAYSTWDQRRPNEGTFRSIVSLRYPHAAAPRGASVIINSPVDGACDATTLQIMPTLRSCNAIQGDLMKNGRAVANLAGLALIQVPQDLSYLLLPTADDGCTIVAIRVIRSQ